MGELTNYPFGLTSFGIPLLGGSPFSIPKTNGQCWFVDQVNGNDGNSGSDPSSAFKTITAAHKAAQAGDTIEIFPGSYTENIVITKDYITLQGAQLGGYARPDVVPAAGVPLTVKAQGFVSVHVRYAGTAADSVVQTGNGFLFVDCVFDGDGTAGKAGCRLLPSSTLTGQTASEGNISGNLFRGCAFGLLFDTGAAPVGVGSTDNVIQGNRFYSNTIDIATAKTGAAGTYSVQLVTIAGNYFADKNKATYIDFTTNEDGPAASQTGTVDGNFFASDTMTTTKIKAVGTGFTFVGNADTVGIFDGSGLD